MSGKLSMAELQSYFEYSESRLGSQPPLAERYAALSAAVSSKPDGSQQADFEEFVDLVRAQVAASEGSKGWVVSQVGADNTPLIHQPPPHPSPLAQPAKLSPGTLSACMTD